MVKSYRLALGSHSILTVACDDRRLDAMFPCFSEAFAHAGRKRGARVQLSLSLRSAPDDRVPINSVPGQLLEMCNRIEGARRGTPTANRGQPVVESKIDSVLGVDVAPRLECRNLRVDDHSIEVKEERGQQVRGTYTAKA